MVIEHNCFWLARCQDWVSQKLSNRMRFGFFFSSKFACSCYYPSTQFSHCDSFENPLSEHQIPLTLRFKWIISSQNHFWVDARWGDTPHCQTSASDRHSNCFVSPPRSFPRSSASEWSRGPPSGDFTFSHRSPERYDNYSDVIGALKRLKWPAAPLFLQADNKNTYFSLWGESNASAGYNRFTTRWEMTKTTNSTMYGVTKLWNSLELSLYSLS